MMISWFGQRLYGRVDEQSGSCIATLFFHWNWMPIVPLGSFLVTADGHIPLGANLRSILAGYVRTWGVLAAVILTIVGYFKIVNEPDPNAAFATALVGLLVVVGVILSHTWLGRLSEDQRAQRSVYERVTGSAVDVALLGDSRQALAATLKAFIARKIEGLPASGYRASVTLGEACYAAALNPAVKDSALIEAAFTVARLEWSLTSGASRAAAAETHGRLWERLRAEEVEVAREGMKLKERGVVGSLLIVTALAVPLSLYAYGMNERQARGRAKVAKETAKSASPTSAEAAPSRPLPQASPGLELQPLPYTEARAKFKTKLLRRGPSPQDYQPESPPPGARSIDYTSGRLKLKAWVTDPPPDGRPKPAVLFLHGGFAFALDDWEMTKQYRDASNREPGELGNLIDPGRAEVRLESARERLPRSEDHGHAFDPHHPPPRPRPIASNSRAAAPQHRSTSPGHRYPTSQ
jgi:hypothetical protein